MANIIHPGIKDSRVLTYLNLRDKPAYVNTSEENALKELWKTKFNQAKSEREKSIANDKNLKIWRNAYAGDFNKLNEHGEITEDKMKAIRKLAFELVDGKINSHLPAPKMTPRFHADLTPVNATEHLIVHNMDKICSEEVNDESEHNVLIDGTSWFYVGWNPFDNTHERSGNPVVYACPVDSVTPQPGVKDYRQMEYIFEETTITVAQAIDLYNREIVSPNANDIVPIINVYYLNDKRYVGKFTWCDETGQVLCNDLEWGIRKRRECTDCNTPVTFEDVCPVCGGKHFEYRPVTEEVLQEPLKFITNPYRTNQSNDTEDDETQVDETKEIPAGTVIPHYLIRQLPFVPYKRISMPGTIYGISEVKMILEDQDLINKLLNKAENKSNESKTYVTKLKDTNISPKNNEISWVEVESPQEGQSIQVKQVMSDIQQEITQAQLLYELAKSTVGVTDTDQGKYDPSARSGKAKQLQMAASAKRNDSPNALRNLAFSGVYELIFKNLLAYCDEPREFVSLLPDGTQMEEVWSKYMFLQLDKNGNYYYRDDFAWSVDTAAEITQDRAAMWQLIDNDFINGTMGTQIDAARALKMYWQMKEQFGYPTAKYALAFMQDAEKHLPSDIEKAMVENPQLVQMVLAAMQEQQAALGLGTTGSAGAGNRGGARPNAGRQGNGATHAANVEKTNNANRAEQGTAQTNSNAEKTGGMQGGTGGSV